MSDDELIHPSRDFSEQFATLEAQVAAMTADRDLWRDAHNDDCPNKAAVEALEDQNRQLREALTMPIRTVEAEAIGLYECDDPELVEQIQIIYSSRLAALAATEPQ